MTRKLNTPRLPVKVLSALFVMVCSLFSATAAHAVNSTPSTTVIISQVYGAGGNAGASLNSDFVELFNLTASPISIGGWSVQYASAAGTTIASVSPIPAGASIPANGYYLLAADGSSGGGTGVCEAVDAFAGYTGTTANMQIAAGGGKIFLVNNSTALSSTALPNATGGALPTGVVDMVGLNAANAFEGAVGPTATTVLSAQRKNGPAYANTGSNSADFALVTALGGTHNSGGANVTTTCAIATSSASPATAPQGSTTTLTVSLAAGSPVGAGTVTNAEVITADLTAFGGSSTAAFTAPNPIVLSSANAYTLSLVVPNAQTVNPAYSIPITITDKGGNVVTSSIALAVTATPTIPSGSGSASPTPVHQGASTVLSVTVTPGTNPTSTGIAVKADLTAFGGSATQAFTQVGSTNVYSFTLNVSNSQPTNAYTINATITDTQADTVPVVPISLTVNSPSFGSGMVITQMYGAGGNSGATINADYVVLFNPTAAAVTMTGWSIQYVPASSTAPSAVSATNVWPLPTVTIPVGGHYLVGGAVGANGVAPTATYDTVPLNNATTPIGFGFAAGAGDVYLVNSTTPLTSTVLPLSANVVDAITYGTGLTNPQVTGAPTPSTTLLDVRTTPCTDSNNDGADFSAVTITAATALNASSPASPCGPTTASGSGIAVPSTVIVGHNTVLTVTIVPGAFPTTFAAGTAGLTVTADLTAYSGSATQAFTQVGSTNQYSYTLTVPVNQPASGNTPITVTVKDTPDGTLAGCCTIPLSIASKTVTSTALSALPAFPIPNQATTLTATVNSTLATGTVSFFDNNVLISNTPSTVTSGVATLAVAGGFAAGTHPLTATYSGDGNFQTSTGSLGLSVIAPPPPDFSLGLSNTQLILSGNVVQATTSVNITAVGGLSSAISLACSGLPSNASCSFSPQAVTPNAGINGAFVASILTVTIDTAKNIQPHLGGKTSGMALAFTLLAVPFALRRRKKLVGLLALLVMLIAGTQFLSGCSAGGTPPGTATLTITATAGTGQTHTATVIVTTQ